MSKELEAAAEAEYPPSILFPGGAAEALRQKKVEAFLAGATHQAKKAQGLVDAVRIFCLEYETNWKCKVCVQTNEEWKRLEAALAAYEEWRAAPPDMQEPKKFELGSTITEKDLKP